MEVIVEVRTRFASAESLVFCTPRRLIWSLDEIRLSSQIRMQISVGQSVPSRQESKHVHCYKSGNLERLSALTRVKIVFVTYSDPRDLFLGYASHLDL